MQYQAGYILESVRDSLLTYSEQHHNESELIGLLRSLCTFNVETAIDLDYKNNIPSILAVATNILTRGLPTLTSVFIEQIFIKALHVTQRVDNFESGKICFPMLDNSFADNDSEAFFKVLHTIDPRAIQRGQYLDFSAVDSSFERNFLLNLIPETSSHLAQLLEMQRIRSSLTRDNNQGREQKIPLSFANDVCHSSSTGQ